MAAVFPGSGLPHRPWAPTTEKRTPGPPLAGRSLFWGRRVPGSTETAKHPEALATERHAQALAALAKQ